MITSKNTLVQDILLLAKNHYTPAKETGPDRVKLARLLCGIYTGMNLEYMTEKDAATLLWMHASPLLDTRSIDKIVLKSMAPCPFKFSRGSRTSCYWSALIESILDEMCVLPVRSNGVNLLPFEIPTVDEKVAKILSGEIV